MNHVTVDECLDQVEHIIAGRLGDTASTPKIKRPTRSESWCPACGDEQTIRKPVNGPKRTTA